MAYLRLKIGKRQVAMARVTTRWEKTGTATRAGNTSTITWSDGSSSTWRWTDPVTESTGKTYTVDEFLPREVSTQFYACSTDDWVYRAVSR